MIGKRSASRGRGHLCLNVVIFRLEGEPCGVRVCERTHCDEVIELDMYIFVKLSCTKSYFSLVGARRSERLVRVQGRHDTQSRVESE